jgi:hypothetical protein
MVCYVFNSLVNEFYLKGNFVDIMANDKVEIGAIYSNERCQISAEIGDIKLGLANGNFRVSPPDVESWMIHVLYRHLQVRSTDGSVSMQGIDGSFDIASTTGNIRLQVNGLQQNDSGLNSVVARKMLNSVSQVRSKTGNIHIELSPEVIEIYGYSFAACG